MIKQLSKIVLLVVIICGVIWLEKTTGVPGMIIDGIMSVVSTVKE
jgi:hypothetical protein